MVRIRDVANLVGKDAHSSCKTIKGNANINELLQITPNACVKDMGGLRGSQICWRRNRIKSVLTG